MGFMQKRFTPYFCFRVYSVCIFAYAISEVFMTFSLLAVLLASSNCFKCVKFPEFCTKKTLIESLLACDTLYHIRYIFEIVYHTVLVLLFLIFILIVALKIFLRRRISKILKLDGKIVEQVTDSRKKYLKLHPVREDFKYNSNRLSCETFALDVCHLRHPNLLLVPIPEKKTFITLEDFMFRRSRIFHEANWKWIPTAPRLKSLPGIMKDVLSAVKYLHERDIYHLNVQPKNILVVETSVGIAAKICDFTLATISEKKEVSSYKVGLEKIKRPPECHLHPNEGRLDGEKFDCWSIGIAAYELFTGGMLTVEFDRHPAKKNVPDLNEARNVLGLQYFVSAMHSRWGVVQHLMYAHPYAAALQRFRNEDFHEFGNNYFDFVYRLLQFRPEQRCTVEAALETKLMKAVVPRRGDKGDVVCV